MDQRIKDVLTCPICFEIYRKPVLTLPCQHNFCRVCLVQLFLNELDQNGCPTCRFKIHLVSGDIDELPRNLLVEQMIAEFEKDDPEQGTSEKANEEDTDMDAQIKLATMYMGKKEYDKAKNVYKKLEPQAKSLQAIKIKIALLQCFIQTQEKEELITKRVDLICQALTNEELSQTEREEASAAVRGLVNELLLHSLQNHAIDLLIHVSVMCEGIDDPSKVLEEHMLCLDKMQGIARSMSRCHKKKEFKKQGYEAMTHIYRNATRVQVEDKDLQCVKIAWCLKYMGFCYNAIGDFTQSLEYNERGINHLKKHFKEKACSYRLYGIIYHNFAAAYKDLKNFPAAKEAYLQALEAYHSAKDWPSIERRNNSVIISATGLSETNKHLK